MTNNTQLPAEVENEIYKLSLEKTFMLDTNNDYQVGFKVGSEEGIRYGATEYAIKLHQAEEESKRLIRVLLETEQAKRDELGSKLHQAEQEIEYNGNEIQRLRGVVSKHKCGRTYNEQKGAIEKMRYLLEKFISRHEAGLLPDRLLYNEIKQFLDGQK